MITYLTGDATQPIETPGTNFIPHICNTAGAWGAGFVIALSNKWAAPEHAYRILGSKGLLQLGQIQVIPVSHGTIVVNMIAQQGLGTHPIDGPPIRYWAVRQALDRLAPIVLAVKGNIHMPRIGCGLAGGEWELMKPIISDALYGIPVFVYDLPQ